MKEIKSKVPEFTVKRSFWHRGKGHATSRLRNFSNKQCCLGFYARECGFTAKEIKGCSTLGSLDIKENWNYDFDGEILGEIMYHNDVDFHNDKEREEVLTGLFAKSGIKVNFVD